MKSFRNLAVLIFAITCFAQTSQAQTDERITTLDFVQVLNDNRDEVIFYYENNWKVLREQAVKNNYIHSFEILETQRSEEAPFDFILRTTYANEEQYEIREENFRQLIEKRGPVRLMNDKKPGDFRKVIFSKEEVKHRN